MTDQLNNLSVIPVDTPLSVQPIPEGFFTGGSLGEFKIEDLLHPEAHITPDMLSRLVEFTYVGRPGESWMKEAVNNRTETPLLEGEVPEETLRFRELLKPYQNEIARCRMIVNHLAQYSNRDDLPAEQRAKIKHLYQIAEMRIMRIGAETMHQLIAGMTPETQEEKPEAHRKGAGATLGLTMLRGALPLENIFAKLGKHTSRTIQVEAKRLRLEDDSYLVGIGYMPEATENDRKQYKNAIIQDDCLSTGMNQEGGIGALFAKGYRPHTIYVPTGWGVTAGVRHLIKDVLPELQGKYGEEVEQLHGQKIKIVPMPVIEVHSVTPAMYLAQLWDPTLMEVGDMGWFNDITAEERKFLPPDKYQAPIGQQTVPVHFREFGLMKLLANIRPQDIDMLIEIMTYVDVATES